MPFLPIIQVRMRKMRRVVALFASYDSHRQGGLTEPQFAALFRDLCSVSDVPPSATLPSRPRTSPMVSPGAVAMLDERARLELKTWEMEASAIFRMAGGADSGIITCDRFLEACKGIPHLANMLKLSTVN